MNNKFIIGISILAACIGIAGMWGIVKKNKQVDSQKFQVETPFVQPPIQPPSQSKPLKSMKLESSAFNHEGLIPSKYTCDGDNISPPLTISKNPNGTQTFVLIMEDPDVPKEVRSDGIWNHWLIWNISRSVKKIDEGKAPQGVVGKNTGGSNTYQGPCPPDREHRYFFRMYALDTNLVLDEKATTKQQLLNTMQGHILAQAELMGRYKRTPQ